MKIGKFEVTYGNKALDLPCEHTEIELAAKLAEKMGDIDSIDITKEGTKEIFAAMANIDGMADFLRDTLVNDVKRYFAAQTDKERDIIRGGFSRTAYLRAQLLIALDVVK